jgi:hypothetical protein
MLFVRASSMRSPKLLPPEWSKRGVSLAAVCRVPLASKKVALLALVKVMAGPVPLSKVRSPAKSRLKVGRAMAAPDPAFSNNVGARSMRK